MPRPPVKAARPGARGHAVLAMSLALLLALLAAAGAPLAASGPLDHVALCREDGVCLPLPQPAESRPLDAPAPPVASKVACEEALLIKRAEGTPPGALERLLRARGYTRLEGRLTPGWWRVCARATGASAQAAEIEDLAALPQVADVDRDGTLQAAWAPNDPYYSWQWPLPTVGAEAAWDTTRGSNTLIAVIDSGFAIDHPDRPASLRLGWDFAEMDSVPQDPNGHGTHVAGIAAAGTHNGTGVAGLCPGCPVLVVRVLGETGYGSWSDLADAITYATDAAGTIAPRLIINLSLGGSASPDEQTMVAEAVNYALSRGALIVAAAGNYGPGATMYPASLAGVLAVSATDSMDRPAAPPYAAFTSQYGDIGAPGVGVYSTYPAGYAYLSGTSMASPLVAGAAGLVWSAHPAYTASQVTTALLAHVDVPAGWNPLYGAGRLNVARAVGPPPTFNHKVYLPLVMR